MRTRYEVLSAWRRRGLKVDNENEVYERWRDSLKCELCGNEYKNNLDKQMEHNHETGEFRNIVCRSCNQRKADKKLQHNNTSGMAGIHKKNEPRGKQGFIWCFRAMVEGKRKTIKQSNDLEFLKGFAKDWKKKNNYIT